jgi:transcriptional regulator of acetoin/glycerol metabolism
LCVKNNLRERPLDDDVLLEMQRYRWPGNVRELQNVLERMLIMSGERVSVNDLPEEILGSDEESEAIPSSALKEYRDHAEREFIIDALKKNSGNITQAAVDLGVRRTYLHKRLTVLKIGKKEFFR